MIYNNSWMTIFFISSFFIIVMLYFYSIFISLYAESFRKTVIKSGYPIDQDQGRWTIKDFIDYFTFICNWNKKKEERREKN
jgi:hypothetical protein